MVEATLADHTASMMTDASNEPEPTPNSNELMNMNSALHYVIQESERQKMFIEE